jgi:hypothetical protein
MEFKLKLLNELQVTMKETLSKSTGMDPHTEYADWSENILVLLVKERNFTILNQYRNMTSIMKEEDIVLLLNIDLKNVRSPTGLMTDV